MNRLALQLESEDLSAVDEDTFLKEQAALMWHEDAETVLKAWKTFSKAYSFYPFSNLIQHFGPFHNGITWPLHTEAVLSGMKETFLPGPFQEMPSAKSFKFIRLKKWSVRPRRWRTNGIAELPC